MKHYVLIIFFFFSQSSSIASIISGIVTDDKGTPVPFASITVKRSSKGAVANSVGRYSLSLPSGTYTIICQHIGYKTADKEVVVQNENIQLDFQLYMQELKMQEVIIKSGEDPALQIMRQTIRKREFFNKQVDSLTVDVYIKGLIRSRAIPNRILGQKIDKSELEKQGIDSAGKGILFLSESLTKVAYKRPDKIKLEVVSSRTSGGGFGLSFPFFINFYTNNVSLFSGNLNPRGFVSPLADGAFHYYRFKFEGSFFENGKMIDRIRVVPRRKNEPLFDGYLQIIDGEWRIHSVNLSTNKGQGLDLLDTVSISQIHAEIERNVYKTSNQVVSIAASFFGFNVAGDFLNVYANYSINPGFKKGFFNRTLIKYDTAFNRKDSSYWSNLRPVPLEPDERRDFILKDSLTKAERDSLFSKSSLDSLRKSQKPVRFKEVAQSGVTRRFYSSKNFVTYRVNSILGGLKYNTVEGVSISARQLLTINPRKGRATYTLGADSRFGFSNHHLNAFGVFTVTSRQQEYKKRYIEFTGGKRLQQFNRDKPISEKVNSLSTLIYKRNYIKLYEAWTGKFEYNTDFDNGFHINVAALYEDRLPLENSTDFSFFRKDKTILPNHPFELPAIPFNRHSAFTGFIKLSFQAGQRYIEFPDRKTAIGSRYPTFSLQYTKGFEGLFKSTANFDKWKFSVYDDVNLKLAGTLGYTINIGGFLNNRHVDIPDYQHFNGNQLLVASRYLNSFQLAPYYRYSNIERIYGVFHAEHHFNGLFTNKIPLFNKLKWNLVAGTNTFYVNRDKYYAEGFAGIENILKLFRIDFIAAKQAQPGNAIGVRVGFGGLLGGSVNAQR